MCPSTVRSVSAEELMACVCWTAYVFKTALFARSGQIRHDRIVEAEDGIILLHKTIGWDILLNCDVLADRWIVH